MGASAPCFMPHAAFPCSYDVDVDLEWSHPSWSPTAAGNPGVIDVGRLYINGEGVGFIHMHRAHVCSPTVASRSGDIDVAGTGEAHPLHLCALRVVRTRRVLCRRCTHPQSSPCALDVALLSWQRPMLVPSCTVGRMRAPRLFSGCLTH
jgi:hypothetical protein